MKGKVHILTNGCPENRIDGARMSEYLSSEGWENTPDMKTADIVIFNACALTNDAEDASMLLIERIKRRKGPDAELIVCGCLPRINERRLRESYDGPVFGSDELDALGRIKDLKSDPGKIESNKLLPLTTVLDRCAWCRSILMKKKSFRLIISKLIEKYMRRYDQAVNILGEGSCYIKVSTGCLCRCSFCAVKLSRGNLKSRTPEKVIEQFERALSEGYSEFALIGSDVGSYGRDLDTDLVYLLGKMTSYDGDFRIKLRNIQPRFLKDMLPGLKGPLSSGKISFIGCAAESGSDRILGLMRRGYTAKDFIDTVVYLNTEFPEVQIRTQLMAGFPTETEEDFKATIRLLDLVRFDFVETYLFQPRPGTEAETFDDMVPRRTAERRLFELSIRSFFHNRKRRVDALKKYRLELREVKGL